MKILLLAKKPPLPPNDGEAIAILRMAEGLTDAGAEVVMVYMNSEKHFYNPSNSSVENKFKLIPVDVSTKPTITGAVGNLFSLKPFHIERFYDNNFEDVIAELSGNSFDIVQCEGLFLTSYIPAIRKSTKAKIIYRSHNIEGNIWKRFSAGEKNPLKKYYYKLQSKRLLKYEKEILNKVDAVVPISKSDAEFYSQYISARKIKYSPTGTQTTNYKQQTTKPYSLYFLGGLDWLPNREGLIWFIRKVYPIIQKEFPDIMLHIAGRNAPANFNNEISGKGIVFHGEVESASKFISDKFICVVPLLSGSGIKIKIIEAMAAEKFVVTTSVGAEGMPAGLENYLSVANSESAFADAIIQALKNPETALHKALEGRNFVSSHLDNRILTKELADFYKTLLS